MAFPEGACGGHFDSTECTAASCNHRVPLLTKCLPFSPVLSRVYMDRIPRYSQIGGVGSGGGPSGLIVHRLAALTGECAE